MCVTRKLSAFLLVGLYTGYTVIMRHSCRYIVFQPDPFFSSGGDRLGFIHSCVAEQVTWDHDKFTQLLLRSVLLLLSELATVRTSYMKISLDRCLCILWSASDHVETATVIKGLAVV